MTLATLKMTQYMQGLISALANSLLILLQAFVKVIVFKVSIDYGDKQYWPHQIRANKAHPFTHLPKKHFLVKTKT